MLFDFSVDILLSGYDRQWDVQYRNLFMNYFLFEVGVEISDHPLTTAGSIHVLSAAVQVGNILMQGNPLITL